MDQFRADAERLSHIILEMQRCFVLHLCKELAPGNVSFPQFFLLAALDHKEVLTMSAIARKMGHTTAAASGLVARLENLGYVVRSSAREDRRKVMVCITEKGSALVRRIREEMVGNLMKVMTTSPPRSKRPGSRSTPRFTITARPTTTRRCAANRGATCWRRGVSKMERADPERGNNWPGAQSTPNS